MRISDWSSDVCSSDLEQSESNNQTTVEQAGVNASSYVNQSGVATAANPNKVDVSQKGNGAESFVAQTGAILNEVEVDQDGNSYSMVLQDGDRKSVVSGKSVSVRVDLGGRRIINKKQN